MTTFRSILFAAICIAILFAPSVSAQALPLTVATYQGNGQMVCSGCPQATYQNFEPLWAKVVDANGVPASGITVYWNVQLGNGYLNNTVSVTDANGLTANQYIVYSVSGSYGYPMSQSQVIASIGTPTTSTATFYETQAFSLYGVGTLLVQAAIQSAPTSLSGSAGTVVQIPISVATGSYNIPIPGVELQLLNNQTTPTVSCAAPTGNGPVGDPGTVMTQSTGYATCYPILSGAGSGSFSILLGGVAYSPMYGQQVGYLQSANIPLTVTAPSPGAIVNLHGNNQSATAGQPLGAGLMATVQDTKGNPIAGQAINWTVSPDTFGTFANSTSVSDGTGLVQTTFTLSGSANGPFTITAGIPNTNIRATFSETAIPRITVATLLKVGGDLQTALASQPFANPLVVQATNTNGQPATGFTVTFTVSGPATFLTTATPITDSTGRAQVTLVAGATVTSQYVYVQATIASLPQVTFQLSVNPAGPAITAGSFVSAADQKAGSLSPCSIASVTGAGLAPSVQGTVPGTPLGAAPTMLAGASLSFALPGSGGAVLAPIFSVSNISGIQSIAFQVPCEVQPGTSVVTAMVGGGTANVTLPILAASPGVYSTKGSDGVSRAILMRADGSFASPSTSSTPNPARPGETVTVFVTGLGPAFPLVGTNQLPPRGGAAAIATGKVVPGIGSGGTAPLVSAQLSADLVGVYEVQFTIPANIGNSDSVGFSIGVIPVNASSAQYSNLVFIPVHQ